MHPLSSRFWWLAVAIMALLALVRGSATAAYDPAGPTPTTGSGGATRSSVSLAGRYGHLGAPQLKRLASGIAPSKTTSTAHLPFHVPDPAAFSDAKARANANRATGTGGPAVVGSQGLGRAPATEQIVTQFAGMSYEQENSLFPQDQFGLWPPDIQIAVGLGTPNPTGAPDIVEFVNSTSEIWTQNPVSYGDLNVFWISSGDVGTFSVSDPRLMYDAASSRWFASSMAYDSSNDGRTYIGVSQTPDPTGNWWLYTIGSNNTGTLYAQPRLGVNLDKVVLTWDDYLTTGFIGEETWVFDKSQLENGTSSPASWQTGPDAGRFAIVPAQSLSSTSTEYLVYNNSRPLPGNPTQTSTLGVIAITGSPVLGTVTSTEWDVQAGFQATSIPPDALQPGGGPPIATNDDRFLAAVWSNNTLWTGGNDLCYPDATVRSCLRIFKVDTTSVPTIPLSFDLGLPNSYLSYPSETVDGAGNAYFSFSESSANLYASAATATLGVNGNYTDLSVPVTTLAGVGVVDVCGMSCSLSPNNNNRWGDYSAASPDPSNTGVVWVAAEYAASNTDTYDWGTGIAEVAWQPPLPSPTATGTPTATSSSTPSVTGTPPASLTSAPSATPTPTATFTPSPSATGTPTATVSSTPDVVWLTPGAPTAISTRVGGSLVNLVIPAGESIAELEIDVATAPIAITPSDPNYHSIPGLAMILIAHDSANNLITSLNTPLTITIFFRPQGTNPFLARIYTLDAQGNTEALATTVSSIGFGAFSATASITHLSPFEIFAPNPGTQVREIYLPAMTSWSVSSGW